MKPWIGLLLLALVACVPSNNPNVGVGVEKVSFYPLETGLEWTYLPLGDRTTDPPYRLIVQGPGTFLNQTVQRVRLSGRGQEQVFYRQVNENGVSLLGYDQIISNSRVEFNPPMLEYPAQNLLAVGYSWSGRSELDSYFVTNGQRQTILRGSISYTYTVTAQEELRVPAGTFRAFKINKRASFLRPNQPTPEVSQWEIWFVPNVGEIRSENGLLMVERNFK